MQSHTSNAGFPPLFYLVSASDPLPFPPSTAHLSPDDWHLFLLVVKAGLKFTSTVLRALHERKKGRKQETETKSMPNLAAALTVAEDLVASLREFQKGGATAQHLGLLRKADRLRHELEEPIDTLYRLHAVSTVFAASYTLLKIGALEALPTVPTTGGEESQGDAGAAELAERCGVDESVITRSMRLLVNEGVVAETGPDRYAHTATSQAYLPAALGGFLASSADTSAAQFALPAYLLSHGRRDLYDLKRSPYAFAKGKEGRTYYDVIGDNAADRDMWNRALESLEKNMPMRGMFPFAALRQQVERDPRSAVRRRGGWRTRPCPARHPRRLPLCRRRHGCPPDPAGPAHRHRLYRR